MLRLAVALKFVFAAFLVLMIGLAPGPAAAIDPAFTTFEAPDTTELLDGCLTDAVRQRIRDLDAAVERLERKIERIEKAEQETLDALYATRDPARRASLMNDITTLKHWRAAWNDYRERLHLLASYYKRFPPCDQRGRRPEWRGGGTSPPTGIGPFTPTDVAACEPPLLAGVVKDFSEHLKRLTDEIDAARRGIEADLGRIADLTARGKGDSADAQIWKDQIKGRLETIARLEDQIRETNRQLRETFNCPRRDTRQSAVPRDPCETGMLAAINAARADPAAYAASLGSARGQAAAEARAFLAGLQPLPALVADARLTAAAKAHAEDLAARDEVGHRGADGRGLLDRFRAQGLYVMLSAEVIAIGQNAPADALRALVIDQGNPGGPHRKDLFNRQLTLAGIACVSTRSHGRVVVVDLSGAPVQ